MVWKDAKDIVDLPPVFFERLKHYFDTYKMVSGEPHTAQIQKVYGAEHAFEVIRAAMHDYEHEFGG
jgi:inorganic pyrophosphatase